MRALILAQLSLISALVGVSPNMAQAEALPEHVLRAAYLYNFAQFTEWPSSQKDEIRYCFYRAKDYLPESEILKTKAIGNRRISVHHVENAESAKSCDVLVIGSHDRYPAYQMINALAKEPVLTIASEHSHRQIKDSIIQLAAEGNHLGFKVNLIAAKEAGLVLSSRMLRVARAVVQE